MDSLGNVFDCFEEDPDEQNSSIKKFFRKEESINYSSKSEDDDLNIDAQNETNLLKEELASLKKENSKLKKVTRLFTQQPFIKIKDIASDGPVAQIILFNSSNTSKLAEELNEVIIKHIKKFKKHDYNQQNEVEKPQTSAVLFPEKTIKNYDLIDEDKLRPKYEKRLGKAYTATHCYQLFNASFYLDLLGSSSEEKFCSFDFERGVLDPLTGIIELSENINNKKQKPKKCCWNCDSEDHEIKDCPRPKNQANINKNKSLFQSFMNNGSQIYEIDEKYNKYKPGVISDQLREALGLKGHQIPFYIYQMRQYGYPPGHLEEAKVSFNNQLSFYHNVNEVNDDSSKKLLNDVEDKIDLDKLISYPGFNDAIKRPLIDEGHKYRAPPMRPQDNIMTIKNYYRNRNSYIDGQLSSIEKEQEKRRREYDLECERKKIMESNQNVQADMEISSDDENNEKHLQSVSSTPVASNRQLPKEAFYQPTPVPYEPNHPAISYTSNNFDHNGQNSPKLAYSKQTSDEKEDGEIYSPSCAFETDNQDTELVTSSLKSNCEDLTEEEQAMRLELLKSLGKRKNSDELPLAKKVKVEHKSSLPDLSLFSKGVAPFQYDENCTPSKGIFTKLKDIIGKK